MMISALDYLIMTPDQKINWRVENGVTIKDWYNSLKPKLVEEDVSATEFCRLIGITYNTFIRLLDEGRLEGTYNINASNASGFEWRVPYDLVNKIREKEILLIRRRDLAETIVRRGLAPSLSSVKSYLTLNFGNLFFSTFQGRGPSHKIRMPDAARILSDLRRRKKISETFFSLNNVIDAVGSVCSRKREKERLEVGIASGRIRALKFSPIGDRETSWLLPPEEYYRVVEEETQRLRLVRENYTAGEVAGILGVSVHSVRRGLRTGKIPSVTSAGLRKNNHEIGYVITPHVVDELRQEGFGRDQYQMILTARIMAMDLDHSILDVQLGTDINEVPLELERQLWLLARVGNERAFRILTDLYEIEIRKMAGSCRFRNVPFGDRYHYGMLGLYHAITRISDYDGNIRGYAMRTIKWTVHRYSEQDLPSRLSLNRLFEFEVI